MAPSSDGQDSCSCDSYGLIGGERQRIYSEAEVLMSPPLEPSLNQRRKPQLCVDVKPFVPTSVTAVSEATTAESSGGQTIGEFLDSSDECAGDLLPSFRLKEKTEICKNWLATAHCKYGAKCAFAHGESQIQKKQHVAPRYKVTKCRSFHTDGFCMYGARCQFAHLLRDKCATHE